MQTLLYLWNTVFKVHLDRCDQHSHETLHFSVKEHRLNSETKVYSSRAPGFVTCLAHKGIDVSGLSILYYPFGFL